eukprot:6479596-Prymnesium_polylepis.1
MQHPVSARLQKGATKAAVRLPGEVGTVRGPTSDWFGRVTPRKSLKSSRSALSETASERSNVSERSHVRPVHTRRNGKGCGATARTRQLLPSMTVRTSRMRRSRFAARDSSVRSLSYRIVTVRAYLTRLLPIFLMVTPRWLVREDIGVVTLRSSSMILPFGRLARPLLCNSGRLSSSAAWKPIALAKRSADCCTSWSRSSRSASFPACTVWRRACMLLHGIISRRRRRAPPKGGERGAGEGARAARGVRNCPPPQRFLVDKLTTPRRLRDDR